MDTGLFLQDSATPSISPIPNISDTWIIFDLITRSEASGFISGISHDEIIDTNTRLREDDDYESSIKRISLRYKHDMPDLATAMFSRLQGIAPPELSFDQEDDEIGPFLKGTWSFHSVNEKISFLKYGPGGVFSKHRDGIFIKHQDLRSMITILVYLNDDYVGGRTKAYSYDEQHEFTIEPVVGSAFMMVQKVLHEGGVVQEGEKHVARFDLLYHRVTEFVQEIQDKNALAAEYLQMAGEFERSHQGMQAVKYYQMAFKLNPKLEDMF